VSTDASPFIGIVTVLYNTDQVLPDFFQSLADQRDIRFRIYVIDNGTTDSGTRASEVLARRHGIDAVCVFNNANVGVAKGNNQGIELALADGCTHVLLANNDTQFGPATVSTLLATMKQHADLAATPKIMYHGEPHLIWYAGGHINAWTMRTPHYGDRKRDTGQFDRQTYVGYAPTCFMLLDCRVFDAVGFMDEAYFVYSDDTDFVWRMKERAIRIRFVPAAVVLHKVSSSTGGSSSPFTVYYTNRNRIYFVRKNLSGLQRIVAAAYILCTRIPRLSLLPWSIWKSGWRGVLEGFRMAIPSPSKGRL
jgi:GT2 family glycosyltransferase